MARRTKKEAEATRKSILDAALDIIYEKGYARTTFVDIADRIKLTKGAVYWHFKNKPDMFLALASSLERQIEKKMGSVLTDTRTLADLKQALYEMILLVVEEEHFRQYYTIVFYRMEWTEELMPVKQFFENQDRSMISWVVDLLSDAQSTGTIPTGKAIDVLARALLELVNGLIAFCLSGKNAKNDHQSTIVKTGLDTFFMGLQAEFNESAEDDDI